MIYGTKLKNIIFSNGHTLTSINAELNRMNNTKCTVQNLSNKIRNETLRHTEVLQILGILGYNCYWTPVDYDFEHLKRIINDIHKIVNCETAEEFGFHKDDVVSTKCK